MAYEAASTHDLAFAREEAYELLNVNATLLDDKFHVLLEIVGPEVYPRQKVEALQARLVEKFSRPIDLYAWSRIEVVHGPQGYITPGQLRRRFDDRQKENLPPEIPLLLEASK